VRALVLSSVRRNRSRYVATLVAIVTGVAFFAATGFVADRVISSLEGDAQRQYGNVDVAVVARSVNDSTLGSAAQNLKIPGAVADRIAARPGVVATGGVLTGAIGFVGKNGKPYATNAVGRLWIADARLNPLDLAQGRAPRAPDEIVIDRGLARERHLSIGQSIPTLTLAGRYLAHIVGISRFGSADSIDSNGTVSLPASRAFAALNSGKREYDEVYVRGPGSQQALRARIAPLVPSAFEAQTGANFLKDKRESIGAVGRYLRNGLQAFAILALLVGAFVIYNTFSVIVAQRMRELAVLAAIGATPKQIKRMLRWEGVVIGLVGSALGLLVGVALTFGLIAILKAAGTDLPGSGLKIAPNNVIGALLLGTVITVASVTIPARRAARTDPIEAMRSSATEAVVPPRRRAVIATTLIVAGVVGLLVGSAAAAIGLAALALFAGAIVGAPYTALLTARIIRPVMSRLGLESRLAVDNLARSPRRTATTSNALLIGVFLVTLVTVAGSNLKDYVVEEINSLGSADYLIESKGGTIDPTLVGKFEAIKDVTNLAPFSREAVTVDGKAAGLSTGDLSAIRRAANIKTVNGSLGAVAPGTIAINGSLPGAQLGRTVTVATSNGHRQRLKVVAVLDRKSIDALQLGSYVDARTFRSIVGDKAPTVAFMDVRNGAQSDTKDAINALADTRPDVTATEGNALGRLLGSVFDFLIEAVDGLLMMSVLIALIGIINTLSLAIIERRRELGLLRVIGMTDHLVERMVRIESLLIAALGTLTGVVLGIFTGWALIHAIDRLTNASVHFNVPYGTIGLVLALGVVLGVLAALLPARRSTRLDLLDALQTT
jgi:putative ABC transport system permease protein